MNTLLERFAVFQSRGLKSALREFVQACLSKEIDVRTSHDGLV